MLSMGRRNLTWERKLPVSRTNGKEQRSHTRRSKKSDRTKSERKRKRSREEHHQILPGKASAQRRRLQPPGRGNTSARKRPGKCLPGNLPPLLGRKVTFLTQAAQPPAALRTVNLRRKERSGPPKRERNITTLCRRGTARYRRGRTRGRTGKWPLTRSRRIAPTRTDGPGLQLRQKGGGQGQEFIFQHCLVARLVSALGFASIRAPGGAGEPWQPPVGASSLSFDLTLRNPVGWRTGSLVLPAADSSVPGSPLTGRNVTGPLQGGGSPLRTTFFFFFLTRFYLLGYQLTCHRRRERRKVWGQSASTGFNPAVALSSHPPAGAELCGGAQLGTGGSARGHCSSQPKARSLLP